MRRAMLTIIATIVALILLLQFKSHPAGSGGFATVAIPPSAHQGNQHRALVRRPVAPHGSTAASPTHHPTSPAPPQTKRVTGQAVQTPYGPVQVRIVERAGRLIDVVALRLPGGNPRSTEIAAGAAPVLRNEALSANSSHIHVVSGATYTSNGYAQSLQSAIDSA